MSDESDDGCDADGAFTAAAAAKLLRQCSEYDTMMNMDPISDVDRL